MTPSNELLAQTYDDTPYLSAAYPLTSPEHVGAVAHLFGLPCATPARARVLEIGCAAGGNLIAFASRHPRARAVGIDLSAVQIAHGRRAVDALGLENIELIHGDIAGFDETLGTFDYVICHGVFSWVPAHVREAILRLTHACLAENGVAYISYNAYPGWKSTEIVRDAMRFHADARTHREQLPYARGMIEFLQQFTPPESPVRSAVDAAFETVRHGDANYVVHEYLEPFNQPLYFTDFTNAAQRHGLAYLSESKLNTMFPEIFVPHAAQSLRREYGDARGAARIALEQTMDFLCNRTFRETLLVRSEAAAQIRHDVPFERIEPLHVATHLSPIDGADGELKARSGAHVRIGDPVTDSIVRALNEAWPLTVPVRTLIDDAAQSIDDHTAGREHAKKVVMQLIVTATVQLRMAPLAASPAAHPCVHPAIRRLEALRAEGPLPIVSFNAWHESQLLSNPVIALLLPLLDGEHDGRALHDALRAAVRADTLAFAQNGKPLTDAGAIEEAIVDNTRDALDWLMREGFLMPWGGEPDDRNPEKTGDRRHSNVDKRNVNGRKSDKAGKRR